MEPTGVDRHRTRRAGNGAGGKRCDIDGMTRTGELAGVSESSRRIDGQAAEGRGAELGKRSINTSQSREWNERDE
jgi:hypothetical protein